VFLREEAVSTIDDRYCLLIYQFAGGENLDIAEAFELERASIAN